MINTFYIYQHIDPRTNLIRYIGKGRGKRAWDLRDRNAYHKNWLKQLKSEGLEPIVELIETDKTEEQAFELERLWIAACRSSFQPLTNLTDGGEGASGCVKSQETRRKQSEAMRGEKHPMFGRTGDKNPRFGKTLSEEHRRKISEALTGKAISEETRRKLSDVNRGKTLSEGTKRKISAAHSGEKHHMFGKTHGETTRRKMSEAKLGKAQTEEHRRKNSESNTGKTHSEDSKRKISEAKRRPVVAINLATGEERTFESATAAATFVSGQISHISNCCLGKRKAHKGWIFRYLESNTNKGETR